MSILKLLSVSIQYYVSFRLNECWRWFIHCPPYLIFTDTNLNSDSCIKFTWCTRDISRPWVLLLFWCTTFITGQPELLALNFDIQNQTLIVCRPLVSDFKSFQFLGFLNLAFSKNLSFTKPQDFNLEVECLDLEKRNSWEMETWKRAFVWQLFILLY